jgi:preprotein translocase subunit YajC
MFLNPNFTLIIGAAVAPTNGIGAMVNFFGPMLIVLAIFWFLVFRPQQKKAKEHRAKIDAAKKGDTVVTAGGIIGKVTKVESDIVEVEIAANVKVKVYRSTLTDITPFGSAKPAND